MAENQSPQPGQKKAQSRELKQEQEKNDLARRQAQGKLDLNPDGSRTESSHGTNKEPPGAPVTRAHDKLRSYNSSSKSGGYGGGNR